MHPIRGFGLALGIAVLITLAPASPAAAALDRLGPGQSLPSGQSIGTMTSTLTMQADGSLVLRVALGVTLWTSGTTGYPSAQLTLRPDGDLVIYDASGSPRWSSGTAGQGTTRAVMQADGNFVLYAGTRAAWSSRTYKQAYAVNRFPLYGWNATQWPCLSQLWLRESGWNERAGNASSGPYGIPQAYPASKMAAAGADYLTNPRTQIHWGEDYISARYRTPCAAWAFFLAHNWY